MPSIEKALRRDNKRSKRQRMVVDGKSIFVIQEEQRKKHNEIQKARKQKEIAIDSYLTSD